MNFQCCMLFPSVNMQFPNKWIGRSKRARRSPNSLYLNLLDLMSDIYVRE